jgi:hypothetical protein
MTRTDTFPILLELEVDAELEYEEKQDEYSRSGTVYCNPKLVSFEMPTREKIETEIKKQDLMRYLVG